MKGLFKQAEFCKKGYWKPISQDPADWPKDVLSTFLDEFPEFTSQELHINFARKDPEKGYAIGAITIGKTKDLALPVIINQFKLADLDIIVAQGKILPLTRENIFTLFSSRTAFAQLTPSDQSGLFIPLFDNALRAAHGVVGPYGTYSMTAKTGADHSFIDTISSSVTKKAKNELLGAVKTANLSIVFEKNGTSDILKKIETLPDAGSVNVKIAMSHALERDIYYIYQSGNDEFTGIFGNSEVFDPQIVKMSTSDVENFDKICLKSVEKTEIDDKMTKFAEFSIKNREGDRILINTKGEYIELSPGEKVSLHEKVSEMINFKSSDPQSGHRYVLKIGNTGKDCLSPVQVQNIRYFDKTACITVFDGLREQKWYPTRGIKDIIPHENEKNAYYIPETSKFIEITKKASRKFSKHVSCDSVTKLANNFYSLKGPSFEKFAKSTNQHVETTDFPNAIWSLIQTGADRSILSKVAELKTDETLFLDYKLRIPTSIEHCADKFQCEYSEKFAEVSDEQLTNIDLVKLAAEIKDKTTVDAILSLGFMNKDNVAEFVQQLPMYEQVLSDLAKLLLMIRLGLNTMSEEPVQSALRHLVRVVERLRGIGKLSKVE